MTRFETEVLAAAGLNHRCIVTVYEVGQQDGVHFYSMRMLTGGDLRRRIEAGLKPIEALAILRELTGAFAHAHAKNFVHRDVKPENVLFDDEGLPVLTDFGIAKALGAGSDLTGTGNAIGTPRYLSPEQARGKPVDARSDLYSLGAMLYEMLVGSPPYDGEDSVSIILKHVSDPIPQLPPEHALYQPLVEQLMAKKPDDRIPSAKELRRRIDALQPRWSSGNTSPQSNQTVANLDLQRIPPPGATKVSPAVATGTQTTGARGVAKILKKAAQERAPDLAEGKASVPTTGAPAQPEVEGEPPPPARSPLFMRLVVPVGATVGALLVAVAVWAVFTGEKSDVTASADAEPSTVSTDSPASSDVTPLPTLPVSTAPVAAEPQVSVAEPASPPYKNHKRKRLGLETADTPPGTVQPAPLQPATTQPAAPKAAEYAAPDPEVRRGGLRMEQMIQKPVRFPPPSASPTPTPSPTPSRPASSSKVPEEDDPLVQRQREMDEQRRKKLEAEQKAATQIEQEDEFLKERALKLKQEQARREEAKLKKEQENGQKEPPKTNPPAPTGQPPGS